MKKILILAAFVSVAVSGNTFARGSSHSGSYGTGHSSSYNFTSSRSDHAISGYTRSNGTYVRPSHATNPDATKNNNYTTRGNVNPYTGKIGTKPRD